MSRRARPLLYCLLAALAACAPRPEIERITLLFTNDLEGRLAPGRDGDGGIARIAALKQKILAENPNTLLLDAGDAVVGSALVAETRGEAAVRLMNAAGYDAAALGNHEFDLGREQVARYRELAQFPYLAANVADEQGAPVADAAAQIFTLGRVRLAVIGLTTPNTYHLVDPQGVRGLAFNPPEAAVRRVQDEFAGQADLFILLSHLGVGEDLQLTSQMQGVGLIIGGHSQIEIDGLRLRHDVRVAQAGSRGRYVGRVDLDYDTARHQVVRWSGNLIALDSSLPSDPATLAALDREIRALPPGLDRELCTLWYPRSSARVGRWAAGAVKEALGTDFGVVNSGGIREGLPWGAITPADLYHVLPFPDRLARFEIRGRDLAKLRESRHLYWSAGPPLEPDRIYTVATADFLLKIHEFPGARQAQTLDRLVRDVLIERLARRKGLD